jgi:hypothetical protein
MNGSSLRILSLEGSKSTPLPSKNKNRFQPTPSSPPPVMPSQQRNSIRSSDVMLPSLIPSKSRPTTHYAINTPKPSKSSGVPRVNVLRESRLHQTFQYKSIGRLKSHRVGFAVYGPKHGHPVFVIGGYGCTRMVGIMFEELAFRYGIRMIWPERPG